MPVMLTVTRMLMSLTGMHIRHFTPYDMLCPDLHGESDQRDVQRIDALPLPPNFLDTLIEKLGGPGAVAEMTGRKGRVIRDSKGHGVYELRAKPDSSEMDSLNVKEAGGLDYYLQAAAKLS